MADKTTLEIGAGPTPVKLVVPIGDGFLSRLKFLFNGKLQYEVRFVAAALKDNVGGEFGKDTLQVVRSTVEQVYDILRKISTTSPIKDRAQVKGNVFRFEASQGILGKLVPVVGAQFQMTRPGKDTAWDLGEDCSASKAFLTKATDYADADSIKKYAAKILDHDDRSVPNLCWLISIPIMRDGIAMGVLCVGGAAGDYDEDTLRLVDQVLYDAVKKIAEIWTKIPAKLVFVGEKDA